MRRMQVVLVLVHLARDHIDVVGGATGDFVTKKFTSARKVTDVNVLDPSLGFVRRNLALGFFSHRVRMMMAVFRCSVRVTEATTVSLKAVSISKPRTKGSFT